MFDFKDLTMTLSQFKKTLGAFALASLACTAPQAAIINITPSDADLADLDHDYAYRWSINRADLAGKTITGASIFIDNIRDWTIENNDVLYIQLMNTFVSTSSGIKTYWDDEGGGNYFASSGINLHAYYDLLPYTQAELAQKKTVDLTYTFSASELATLTNYLVDGQFSLGFDPDCHYFNDGIKLTLTTADAPPPVPEPGTLVLLGLGLAGLAIVTRRRKT